ncbi:MAG TPA: hypothetical protein VGR43_01010, partial [Dehalococcoidia bacterium]|nr:hypothetical protein [Dehalococcoidia bacterium]
NDALAWEPISFLDDARLGQAFKLIVYGCKLGGSLPADHPLLEMLDPKVVALCTRRVGDRVEVIAPHDLPRLMANRRRWRESRKKGADAAGRGADGRFGSKRKGSDREAEGNPPAMRLAK